MKISVCVAVALLAVASAAPHDHSGDTSLKGMRKYNKDLFFDPSIGSASQTSDSSKPDEAMSVADETPSVDQRQSETSKDQEEQAVPAEPSVVPEAHEDGMATEHDNHHHHHHDHDHDQTMPSNDEDKRVVRPLTQPLQHDEVPAESQDSYAQVDQSQDASPDTSSTSHGDQAPASADSQGHADDLSRDLKPPNSENIWIVNKPTEKTDGVLVLGSDKKIESDDSAKEQDEAAKVEGAPEQPEDEEKNVKAYRGVKGGRYHSRRN